MNRVFCGFSDTEYEKIQNKAKELGMSIPKLVEYATTIYVDLPRKQVTNLQNIQDIIQNFIAQEDVDEFICSDPFDNWENMTMSEKRTAAAQIRKLVDIGVIAKVDSKTKSHRATIYKKNGRK
ncbi:MAG: hypothetical protein ACLUR5_01670 [Eubacterium ventriosum]|jgi:hypothetical protein|uniref:hypothetical protein n=1 Tax=Agathobacter rectalis TaxID=39491 RepID=UPI0039F868FB